MSSTRERAGTSTLGAVAGAPIDVGPLAKVLCSLGDALVGDAGLREIEINPYRLTRAGPPLALDAVLLVTEDT